MLPKQRSEWIALLLALIGGAMVFWVLNTFLQNTVSRVIVTGNFPLNSKVIVGSVTDAGVTQWQEEFFIQSNRNHNHEVGGTSYINKPLENLSIEFIRQEDDLTVPYANSIVLQNIQVIMPYSLDRFYSVDYIAPSFHSEHAVPDGSALYEYDNLKRVKLLSVDPPGLGNKVLTLGISLLFTLGIYLIVKNSQWRQIAAFSDMSLGNRISSNTEFNTINGIRGLAAILVLFSHAAPGFAVNQMGLALLFVISGFLLAKPFILDSGKIYSWANIERYLTKRIKRILPMYYLFVFISYVLSYQFDTAIRHFLFIQGEGHLWPMTQIFTFYMLLPLILLATSALHRVNSYLPILVLGLASYFWWKTASDWMPYFSGEYSHQFYLYTFLMGVLISYVYYDLMRNSTWLLAGKDKYPLAIALLALVVTVVVIAWSAPVKPPVFITPYTRQFFYKSIAAAIIVVLALYASRTWFSKLIGNWLFRSVGVVGFSFYLLHALGMQITEKLNAHWLHTEALSGRSWPFAISAFCITYVLAVMAYSYVERPFFGYREQGKKSE